MKKIADIMHLFPEGGVDKAGLEIEVDNVCIDSRKVNAKSIFVALKGQQTDGHSYLDQVAAKGAALAVVKEVNPRIADLRQISVADPANYLTRLCQEIYGTEEISRKLLGVTGTDGKTTTAMMIEYLLNGVEHATGFIGTIGMKSPKRKQRQPLNYTTPPAPELHAILATMAEEKAANICMEVSSQAACQNRVTGISWQTMTFTHLAVDHLDYHGTMDNYAEAKVGLFADLTSSSTAVLNADDLTAYHIAEKTAAKKIFYQLEPDKNFSEYVDEKRAVLGEEWANWSKKLLAKYGRNSRRRIVATGTLLQGLNIVAEAKGFSFNLKICNGDNEILLPIKFHLPIFGYYNLYNALAALATVHAVRPDIEWAVWADLLSKFHGVPGRMESLDLGQNYTAIVDFAHTSGAIEALLTELQRHCTGTGKLWVLCNSCGDRDRGKRPHIARICEKLADKIILTLEEVGNENPWNIIQEIKKGFSAEAKYVVIPERHEAVRAVISQLNDGDIFVLPSLGDERTYNISGYKYPYSEREFLGQCITERMMIEALAAQSPELQAYYQKIYFARWRDFNQSAMNE